jgi:hypothetical protein
MVEGGFNAAQVLSALRAMICDASDAARVLENEKER